MAIASRMRLSATLKRKPTEPAGDGYGGVGVVDANLTTIATGLRFDKFNLTPYDRESFASKYGVAPDAILMRAYMEYRAAVGELVNGDILEVSATERYRVLACTLAYGRGSVPNHMDALLMVEGSPLV